MRKSTDIGSTVAAVFLVIAASMAVGGGDEHGCGGHDEGEESGDLICPGETHDATRNGVRLILSYEPTTRAFVGTVENTTDSTLCGVRVEVHLDDGPELGPTTPSDLGPGAQADVFLSAEEDNVHCWSAHPETSNCSGP